MDEKQNDFKAREIESIEILDRKILEANQDILPDMSKEYWLKGGLCIIPIKKLDDSVVYGTSYGTSLDTVAGVRPLIEFHDPNKFIFSHRGDKLNFEGVEWTVISKNEAVCNDFIGHSPYQSKTEERDADVYDKSDIRCFTEDWLNTLKMKEASLDEKEPEQEEIDR